MVPFMPVMLKSMGARGSWLKGASLGSHQSTSVISMRQSQKGMRTNGNSSPFDLWIEMMRRPSASGL